MHGFTTVPFKTESEHGLTSVNGVAKFSPAGVVLEFEAKLFGLIGGGVQEVRLPKDEILDLKFKKGLFKRLAKIEIRMKTFGRMADLPMKNGKLTLKLFHDDFDRAQSAVEQLQKEMATASLPHSPVDELIVDETEEDTRELITGDRE